MALCVSVVFQPHRWHRACLTPSHTTLILGVFFILPPSTGVLFVLYFSQGSHTKVGNGREAMECARRAMHYSSTSTRDIGLVHVANILHRAGFLTGILLSFLLPIAHRCRCTSSGAYCPDPRSILHTRHVHARQHLLSNEREPPRSTVL